MSETAELLFFLVVAAAGGAIAASLVRVPKVAGYLLAGALVGPAGLRLVDNPDQTQFVAEFGLALLLFAVGVELSLRELWSSLRSGLVIGAGELLVVGAVTFPLAHALGLSPQGSLLLAGAAGMSSTAALLALLGSLGERGQRIAPTVVAVAVLQDIVAVVLIGAGPRLTAEADTAVFAATLARILAAIVALGVALPLLALLVHWGLRFVVQQVDRELFLITVVAGIGLIAAASLELGLSVALGAFLAGLVMSESGYAEQALAETRALKSVFAAAFFVSAGLLVDPAVVAEEARLFGLLLGTAVVVKCVAISVLARLSGWSWSGGLLIGVLLANAGEFSFAVAEAAPAEVIPAGPRAALVTTVMVSLLVTSGVAAVLARGALPAARPSPADVILIGYGRLGRQVARLLRERGVGVFVVERDADLARLAAADGFPAFWGDASQRALLRRLGRGRVYLVTPTGQAGADLVDTLAELAPGARVVTASAPEGHLSRLGLDLTIVDVDTPAAQQVAAAVERALTTAAQPYTVRSAAGTFRFAIGRPERPPRWWRRLAADWFRPPAARAAERCQACQGRGRRLAEGRFVTCSVCGGDGRRSPFPGSLTAAGTFEEAPQRSGRGTYEP
jgi:CPA2 family monovalent cation:H+ antiporter-2